VGKGLLRAALIAACLAAPAIVSAIALTTLEIYRAVEPDAPVFDGPPPATLAESIGKRFGVEQTFQFIRNGQDPNRPIQVDDPEYTGGTTLRVSPLLLAVAARDGAAVQMLLSFGARLELPQNRHVECLAREVANDEILEILAEHGAASSPAACAERRPDAPTPLVAWSD
jgi:hypothetical protein